MHRNDHEEIHLEMLRNADRFPQPGLLRVRVYSRFRQATKYQLWIEYRLTNVNRFIDEVNDDQNPIVSHYCTCKSGARTLCTCAHIASVL